jgi:hypothetical protein
LRSQGVSAISLVHPPQAYNPEKIARLETLMLNLGFTVSNAELSAVIHVSDKPFAEILHPRKRRKLSQTLPHGFRFAVLDKNDLQHVFDFIASLRKQKNYTLSVSFEHLSNSVNKIPHAYILFAVYDGEQMVAASVAVRVSEKILYHFISDHIRKIGEAKPSLVLMQGIYDYCRAHGIELLDLGTSVKDSIPNFKLIKFKTEIGGTLSHKFTLSKKLA